MSQATSSTPAAKGELIWAEIINAFPRGSEPYKTVFSQLQGSPDPFEAAMAIVAALPEDLGNRCQITLRTWAIRESARQEEKAQQAAKRQETQQAAAREEKEQGAARLEKKAERKFELARLEAARKEKEAERVYELERLKLAPQNNTSTKKRARPSDDDAQDDGISTRTAAGSSKGTGKAPKAKCCVKNGKNRTKGMCLKHGGKMKCKYVNGCEKESKLKGFCIAHGGGRKCEFDGPRGCEKNAERKGMCSAHGGKRKCAFASGCDKNAVRTGMCISHGGRRKCEFEGGGCEKNARGNGFCCAHGGEEKKKKKKKKKQKVMLDS